MLNLNNDQTIAYLWQELQRLFVRKEPGKGLSTEDFTTEEKRKLAGIAEGAQAYAPGDIFVTTRAGNPAELLGYGTWSQIKDRFLLAAGDSYAAGSTGGEAKHTLTEAEMPKHTHNAGVGGGSSDYGGTRTVINSYDHKTEGWVDSSINFSTGNSQSHNNMPPYLAVYMWLRTA